MTHIDDLQAERFGKSLWWKSPEPDRVNHPMRALLDWAERDDALTIARRRKVLTEAYNEPVEETA